MLKLTKYFNWIFNVFKKKTFCRCRFSSPATIFCINDRLKFLKIYFPVPHFDHCHHNRSYHIPQKSVCFYCKDQAIIIFSQGSMVYFAEIGFIVGMKLAETGKI